MKKLQRIPILIMFLFPFAVFSQSQDTYWDHCYGGSDGEELKGMINSGDGGMLLYGSSKSNISCEKSQGPQGLIDYWVVKINAEGAYEWDQTFGSITHDDLIQAAIPTADQGFLLGGFTEAGTSGDKSQDSWGVRDYWVVKIDSTGNKLWDARYGSIENESLQALVQTADGGYLLGGRSYGGPVNGDKTDPGYGGDDYWIVKIDANGNYQWDKCYGGTGNEELKSMVSSSSGNYYLCGNSISGISGNKTANSWGQHDYWLVKIDAEGNALWDQNYGTPLEDDLFSMDIAADGNLFLAGITDKIGIGGDKTEANWGGELDWWIIKADSMGNKIWDHHYGGTDDESSVNISCTSDSGFIAAGWSESSISGDVTEQYVLHHHTWVLKADRDGIKQWDQTPQDLDESFFAYAMETSDGCFLIGNNGSAPIYGDVTEIPCGGISDIDFWVMKLCNEEPPQINYLDIDQTICEDGIAYFSVDALYFPYNFTWNFPGGTPSQFVGDFAIITYSNPGIYDVEVIAMNGAGADTILFQDTIHVEPNPSPYILQNGNELTAYPAGNYLYQWYLNNVEIWTAVFQTYTAIQSGNYKVRVEDIHTNCYGFSPK